MQQKDMRYQETRSATLALNGRPQPCFIYMVYPTNLRARGVGLASFWGWVGGMLWPALGHLLETSHHPILLFGLYAFKIMISVVCALLLPVETLGRELEENEDSE
ncbi:organic cation/carnitine transporter 7-like protein [Tanacetum coccineum]